MFSRDKKSIRPFPSYPFLRAFVIFLFLLAFSLSTIAGKCRAATYYVDATNGNDNNDGLSPATAWKTIFQVNKNHFQPGDFIKFRRGEVWRERLIILSHGAEGEPITYTSYGEGPKPVITGANLISAWSLTEHPGQKVWNAEIQERPQAVYFNGKRGTKENSITNLDTEGEWCEKSGELFVYSTDNPETTFTSPGIEASVRDKCVDGNNKDFITINGLEIRNGHTWGIYAAGTVSGSTDCDNWIIRNCDIHDNGPGSGDLVIAPCGIYMGMLADNWIIEDNILTNNDSYEEYGSHTGAGIYIGDVYDNIIRCSNNNIVRRNYIKDGHSGITMKYGSGNNIVENNIIQNMSYIGVASWPKGNKNYIRYNNISGVLDSAIEVGADTEIYYNIIQNCKNGVFINAQSSEFENYYNCGDNVVVYNNTIYNCSEYAVAIWNNGMPSAENNVIKNNIFSGFYRAIRFREKKDIDKNIIDFNCYNDGSPVTFYVDDDGGTKSFLEWKEYNGSPDKHSLESDPSFTAAPSGNFRLKGTSRCIDAGVYHGFSRTDYDGNIVPINGIFDVGALEYNSEDKGIPPPKNLRLILH